MAIGGWEVKGEREQEEGRGRRRWERENKRRGAERRTSKDGEGEWEEGRGSIRSIKCPDILLGFLLFLNLILHLMSFWGIVSIRGNIGTDILIFYFIIHFVWSFYFWIYFYKLKVFLKYFRAPQHVWIFSRNDLYYITK